ncbi:transposase, partial [Methylibium sp.]|uniref:transposase n=1 Tax=Methylibium sp. TaxID=2067992 RepID=UPI00345B84FB
MEITQAQFEQIEHCLPTQRGNVSLSNLTVLNAVLYVAEHGCKVSVPRSHLALREPRPKRRSSRV